ncbi:asparaginase domain-containing protein [Leucobacter massiliensis]|uniref:L-asparaginase n=1 Tax=Leucobacter massiliensis TaxID=1686285 RepID=A0A2S9QMA5_9MICO|nr:asparaginase domain-containing protein [Leucobacter massiliensis]PRI10726.1 hypothetical protein B4915_07440 [Leucobacter massiliensis]
MTGADGAERLLLVYCGGTFGMRDSGRGLVAQRDLGGVLGELVRECSAQRSRDVDWELAQPPEIIDSAEAGHGTALSIADLIRERLGSADRAGSPFAGVLVVHGTDTLAHAAAQAAFALADLRTPVVYTGAMHPLGTPGGDAERNFARAFAAALAGGGPGVRLVFGSADLPAVRAVKRSSEADEAFAATRPLAEPTTSVPGLAAALAGAAGAIPPRVGMLTAVPGLPPALVEAALLAFPDGLVLECYGAGTAPLSGRDAREVLLGARDRGTPVLAITRCAHGAVELQRYAVGAALAEAGVIGGSDLTAEAAIAKLRALLRAGYTGERLALLLRLNLVGEQRPLGE